MAVFSCYMLVKQKIKYGLLWLISLLLLLNSPLLLAHNGEVHNDEVTPQPQSTQFAPRFAVVSDDIELVGVWIASRLVLYVDHKNDNSPVNDAQVDIQSTALNGTATPLGDGVYQLLASNLEAGTYPLTISISSNELSDLLIADLTIAAAPTANKTTKSPHNYKPLAYVSAVFLIVALVGFYWRKKGATRA